MDQSQRPQILLLVVVLAVLLGVIAVVSTRPNQPDQGKPVPAPEDRQQVRQEMQAAFNDPNAHANAPQEIKTLLDQMGKEMQAGGGNSDQLFDIERFARELDRDGELTRRKLGPNNRHFVGGMKQGMKSAMKQMAPFISWERTEIRTLKWLVADQDVVLITRHFTIDNEEEITFKMRWWAARTPEGWKFYDLEDVSMGERLSTAVLGIVQGLNLNDRALLESIRKTALEMGEAKQAMLRREHAKALEMLKAPLPPGTPALLEGSVQLFMAVCQLELGQAEEALQSLTRAEQKKVDAPVANLLRASAFNHLQRYEEAEAASRLYMDAVGGEGSAFLQLGFAQEQLKRSDEAIESYRRGLDDEPNQLDCLSGLRRCLPHDRKSEFVDRFFRLRKPQTQFALQVNQALIDDDLEGARELTAAYAKRFPDDCEGIFQQGVLQARLNQIDQAKPLFLKALKNAPEEERTNYLHRYLGQMQNAQRSFEAYESVPDADRPRAFRYYADDWLEMLRESDGEDRVQPEKDLRQIIAAHRKHKPDDAMPGYFEAAICFEKKEYAQAERLLSAVPTNGLEEYERSEVESLRIDALYKDGKALTAYEKVGKRAETFRQLASLMTQDKNLDGLEVLLKAHRAAEPHDRALVYFEGERLWQQEKYVEALKRFREYNSGLKKEKEEDRDYYSWQINDRVIRCLVRLKRFDEARGEIELQAESNRWSLLPVIVEAVAGNVEKTEKLLNERIKEGGWTGHLYADPDLGPALRSGAFQKVRDKFPPPNDDRPLRKT